MKKLFFISLLFIAISFTSCEPDAGTGAGTGARTGAVCKDGTTTSATGSGACSHHGGVDHWLY